jgi:hypothetical protein
MSDIIGQVDRPHDDLCLALAIACWLNKLDT